MVLATADCAARYELEVDTASPFEAIRSAEIVPVFTRWFDIEYRHKEGGFMGRICPRGMRANYTETEDGPALFELLMLTESLLVEHGVLAPHTGQYLMQRKAEPAEALGFSR